MFRNNKLLLIIPLIFIAVFFLNYSDNNVVKKLADTTAIHFSASNNQSMDSITLSSKQPQIINIDDMANDDYIVECKSEPLIVVDNYVELQQQYFQSLYNSTSPERLLEYALYANLPIGKSRLDLLLAYNERYPHNPLVLMEAASLCSTSSNDRCSNSFINTAIASDKENGAMWINGVLFFASRGDDEGVLRSISGLVKTSMFNEKSGERINLYAQALAGSNADDFRANIIAAIGIEAARESGLSHVVTWCKEGIDDIQKENACLYFGQNLAQRGKILFSQSIGLAIQKIIYEAEGDTESYSLLEKEDEQLINTLMSEQFFKALSLTFQDEKLLRHWLNNMDSIGEVESAKVLVEEAISLSQKKGVTLCKS